MLAFDPSTGDLTYDTFADTSLRHEIESRLTILAPVEILLFHVSETLESWIKKYKQTSNSSIRIEKMNDILNHNVIHLLKEHFNSNIDLLQKLIKFDAQLQSCVLILMEYLKQFSLDIAFELPITLRHFSSDHSFHWSSSALRHLDIFNTHNEPSLYSIVNQTHFPVSSRTLKTWLVRPFIDSHSILIRQRAVQELLTQLESFTLLQTNLKVLGDAEKCLMKMYYGRISPSSLYTFLMHWLDVVRVFGSFQFQSSLLTRLLHDVVRTQPEVTEFFQPLNKTAALANDKTRLWSHPDLSDLHQELLELTETLAIESRNAAKSVYGSVVSNSGIEFLIEVPKNQTVPSTWLRVNATTKVLRYHTPTVLDLFKQRDLIQDRLKHSAANVFTQQLKQFGQSIFLPFSVAIKKLAEFDCLLSLAKLAKRPGYTLPKVSDEQCIRIKEGRHPVLETLVNYVPNSIELSHNGPRTLILSGLNMGGKSSFVRMIALNVLLTQIGSYVPCESAEIGVFDGIYTRMGAFDDVVTGRSTFSVEMFETSDILSKMTPRSLVILDELGRGTSTNDGMAIAHGVLQHCMEQQPCCLLFITHYLPLASLKDQYPNQIECGHMGFLKDGETCTFLYRYVQGVAQSSHGLNVARLAKLPKSILSLASLKSREVEFKTKLLQMYSKVVQMCKALENRRMKETDMDKEKQKEKDKEPTENMGRHH